MKKLLLLLTILLLVLAIAVPAYADWDDANHPIWTPGEGQPGVGYNNNHRIPPMDSGHAQAPGPVCPGPGRDCSD